MYVETIHKTQMYMDGFSYNVTVNRKKKPQNRQYGYVDLPLVLYNGIYEMCCAKQNKQQLRMQWPQ